jgi:hypothetical protein
MPMIARVPCAAGHCLSVAGLTLGLWVSIAPMAEAQGPALADPSCPVQCGSGPGTLGYGGPGIYPGHYGFGLGFHPGYGYGGSALGVGADGGYPCYGGPGYPYPPPPLRRFHKFLPYPYNGTGYFTFDFPQPSLDVGRLAANRPVVRGTDRADLGSGYPHDGNFGPYTGRFPYPESLFARYVSEAAGSASGTMPSRPSTSTPNRPPASN